MTMLAVGLAVVWVGIAAYVARLALLTSRLEREVKSLRGLIGRERTPGPQTDRPAEPGPPKTE